MVADALKAWREKHNITQHTVATALGVYDRTVSRWEAGEGEPSASQVQKLDAAWPGLGAALGIGARRARA